MVALLSAEIIIEESAGVGIEVCTCFCSFERYTV